MPADPYSVVSHGLCAPLLQISPFSLLGSARNFQKRECIHTYRESRPLTFSEYTIMINPNQQDLWQLLPLLSCISSLLLSQLQVCYHTALPLPVGRLHVTVWVWDICFPRGQGWACIKAPSQTQYFLYHTAEHSFSSISDGVSYTTLGTTDPKTTVPQMQLHPHPREQLCQNNPHSPPVLLGSTTNTRTCTWTQCCSHSQETAQTFHLLYPHSWATNRV